MQANQTDPGIQSMTSLGHQKKTSTSIACKAHNPLEAWQAVWVTYLHFKIDLYRKVENVGHRNKPQTSLAFPDKLFSLFPIQLNWAFQKHCRYKEHSLASTSRGCIKEHFRIVFCQEASPCPCPYLCCLCLGLVVPSCWRASKTSAWSATYPVKELQGQLENTAADAGSTVTMCHVLPFPAWAGKATCLAPEELKTLNAKSSPWNLGISWNLKPTKAACSPRHAHVIRNPLHHGHIHHWCS